MIEKIVSVESPSVSAVVSHVASKLGLVHDLKVDESNSDNVDTLMENAIGASDGSLYFGMNRQTTARHEQVKRCTLRLNKPLIVLDLDRENGFFASQRISSWISENRIKVLHVAGDDNLETLSESVVTDILEATFFLAMMETDATSPKNSMVVGDLNSQPEKPPVTINAARDHLQRGLSLKEKALIANMNVQELPSINSTLGDYINTHFNLFTDNTRLLEDCRRWSGQQDLAPKHAAPVIIRALWEHLRETCRIRVVK